MNKQTVLHILKDIFHAYGYNLDSSYISDFLASKGNSDRIHIKLEEIIDYNSMRKFADSMKHTEGTGLYILNNTATEDIFSFAAQQDLIFWDRRELENQIGRAILSNAEGKPMEIEFMRPDIEKPIHSYGSSTEEDSIFNIFGESASSKSRQPKFKWPGEKSKEDFQKGGSDYEENIVRIPLPSLPINMAKTSAIKIGQAKIGEVQDFLLKFIPHYYYLYDFETKRKFKSKVIDLSGKGEGIVNGITGENKFTHLPKPAEYIDIPTENYQIKEPQFSDKEASDTALHTIIKIHTENRKSDEVRGDAIVSESRTLSPDKNDVNIAMNLVYVPVWEIQGRRNSIEINAYDGHVLDEPVDDDAEFI